MGQCLKKSRSEAMKEEVNVWLQENGLGEYSTKFKEHGWDEMSLLLEMSDIQIEMCIPKPGHVVKFKRALGRFDTRDDDMTNFETSLATVGQEAAEPYVSFSKSAEKQDNQRRDSISTDSEPNEGEPVTMAQVHKLGTIDTEKKFPSEDDSTEEEFVAAAAKRTVEEVSSISSDEMADSFKRSNSADAYNHILGQMEMIAKWYAKKDHLYVETNAFHDFKCILDEVHWTTLLGKPGDGKSAMAAHLMLKYREKGYKPVFLSSAQEWNSLISEDMPYKDAKYFVTIDDIFGTIIVDKRKVDEWKAIIGNMAMIIKERQGDLLVVFTSRRNVFIDVEAELEKYRFWEKDFIIDLTHETYQLTPEEKEEIFDSFAHENHLPERDLLDVRNIESNHGFPHSVELYCTNLHLRRKKGSSFFDDPLECIKEELHDFRETDQLKYIVLLLVLVHNNHLEPDFYTTLMKNATEDEARLFQDTDVSLQTSHRDVSKALHELELSYLTHGPDGAYSFSHELLMETLASIFISVNPSHAIMILDFLFILAFINDGSVNTGNLKDTQRAVIGNLPTGSAQALAQRITKELKEGNMIAAGYCAAWRDQSFVQEWIKYVTSSGDNKADVAQMIASQTETTIF